MKIAQKYSHLNGEEYLLVHHKKLYKEIIDTIRSIDASNFMTKESKEKTMRGKMLYSLEDAVRPNLRLCRLRYPF